MIFSKNIEHNDFKVNYLFTNYHILSMIEPNFLYFGFSFVLLFISLYMRKLESVQQVQTKQKQNPNKLAYIIFNQVKNICNSLLSN